MIARVVVVPKPVVNDPQGVTVRQSLNALGFAEVADVRVGKYIEVRLDGTSEDEARSRVEDMCRRLLANQVIEDYRFEIDARGDFVPPSGTPLLSGTLGGPLVRQGGTPSPLPEPPSLSGTSGGPLVHPSGPGGDPGAHRVDGLTRSGEAHSYPPPPSCSP